MDTCAIQLITSSNYLNNASGKVESKIVVGVNKLKNTDYEKALSLFESALELNHKTPAAWLGKAYSEAYLFSPENNTFDSIKESIEYFNDYLSNKDLFAFHYSRILNVLITKSYKLIADYIYKAKETAECALSNKKGAVSSGIIGIAGAAIGSSSKGKVGKMVGYSAAAAGAGGAYAKGKSSKELKRLSENIYASALAQTHYSTIFLIEARNLIENFPRIKANNVLDKSIKEWKKIVLNLYEIEINRLMEFLKTIKSKIKKHNIDDVLAKANEFQEIIDFRFLSDQIGLDKHDSFTKIHNFFDKICDDAHSKRIIEQHKKTQLIRKGIFGLGVCGIISFLIASSTVPPSFDVVGVLIMYCSRFIRSKLERNMLNRINEFIDFYSKIEIDLEDIKLSYIGTDSEYNMPK